MKIALGTVQFGLNYGIANQRGQVSLDEMATIVRHARTHGIDTLDTAIAYGDSEQRLGQVGVGHWRVVSKLPAVPEGCSDVTGWVAGAVRASLDRLGVPSLHGLLLHQPRQLLGKGGAWIYQALQHIKEQGLVGKVGISIYGPEDLDGLGNYRFDIVQAPFNILDRRLVDTGCMARLLAQGVELHVRSIFLQGLLLMDHGTRPRHFDRWSSLWDMWRDYLRDTRQSPLQACVGHALSYEGIDRVIVGVDSLGQMEEILSAEQGPSRQAVDSLRTDDPALLNPSLWPKPG